MMKARVLPEPVFAAPRTSRPQRAWGKAARWISLISVKLFFRSASLVFCDSGSSSNRVHAPYSGCSPAAGGAGPAPADFEGGGGLVPGRGLPASIHSLRRAISSTSLRRLCFPQPRRFGRRMALGFWVPVPVPGRRGRKVLEGVAALVQRCYRAVLVVGF